jgi:hypothetical protein
LTIKEFFSIAGENVKAQLNNISRLIEHSKGCLHIPLHRGRFKNLVLMTCREKYRLQGSERFEKLIDQFQQRIEELPEKQTSRSEMWRIAERIAYSMKCADLISVLEGIFIDIPYNLNLSYYNGITPFAHRGITGRLLQGLSSKKKSPPDTPRPYRELTFDLPKFEKEETKIFYLTLDRLRIRDLIDIRKSNEDKFVENLAELKKARTHEEFSEILRIHEELLCRELEKRHLIEPIGPPSVFQRFLGSGTTKKVSIFASAGSLVWSYISALSIIPSGFLVSVPIGMLISSITVPLNLSSLVVSSRAASARKKAFIAGLNAVMS